MGNYGTLKYEIDNYNQKYNKYIQSKSLNYLIGYNKYPI